MKWPPAGYDLEARAARRAGESIRARKVKVLAKTLLYFLVMWFGVRVGRFVPEKYTRELVDNSDFRKFDDALRMVLDCTPELADEIEDASESRGSRRRGPLRHAPAGGGHDDVLHALADAAPTTCISSTAPTAATRPRRRP